MVEGQLYMAMLHLTVMALPLGTLPQTTWATLLLQALQHTISKAILLLILELNLQAIIRVVIMLGIRGAIREDIMVGTMVDTMVDIMRDMATMDTTGIGDGMEVGWGGWEWVWVQACLLEASEGFLSLMP